MSTTAIDMARSSFSTAAFAQLVRRLRHTNARYDQIALQFRCRIRSTHHARRRAHRVGLRIDISKARACPQKYVSTHPHPVLDSSPSCSEDWVGTPAMVYGTTELGIRTDRQCVAKGDAYMRDMPLRNCPKAVVHRQCHRNERQRVMLRLPPLKLHLNVDHPCGVAISQLQEPVPGAPRLLPRQLPEDDGDSEDMMLGSASDSSSSMDASDLLSTPVDIQVYSGLCITIPPRNLKRKLQDVEDDENTTLSQGCRRPLKVRWNESKRQ